MKGLATGSMTYTLTQSSGTKNHRPFLRQMRRARAWTTAQAGQPIAADPARLVAGERQAVAYVMRGVVCHAHGGEPDGKQYNEPQQERAQGLNSQRRRRCRLSSGGSSGGCG